MSSSIDYKQIVENQMQEIIQLRECIDNLEKENEEITNKYNKAEISVEQILLPKIEKLIKENAELKKYKDRDDKLKERRKKHNSTYYQKKKQLS